MMSILEPLSLNLMKNFFMQRKILFRFRQKLNEFTVPNETLYFEYLIYVISLITFLLIGKASFFLIREI